MESLIQETITITEIPAPPFKEDERADYILKRFQQIGLYAWKDSLGNVLAHAPRKSESKRIVVFSAHLDTVFEEGVDTSVTREGNVLRAPGICDDSRGLAVLLHIAAIALKESYDTDDIQILFVATLGEEGLGDLRGVKYLFNSEEHKFLITKVSEFVTIDGIGARNIVYKGVGSKRYQISFTGPGGHSYGSFGLVNPIYAMGKVICEISSWSVPQSPRTTFSVGVVEGGRSVNAIPDSASFLIDLRSEDNNILNELCRRLENAVNKAVKEINESGEGKLDFSIEIVGDRPAGMTSLDSFLVKCAERANRLHNIQTDFIASSTDANIPMNLGIPSIAVASADIAGKAHSLNEYLDAGLSSVTVFKRNLTLLQLLINN